MRRAFTLWNGAFTPPAPPEPPPPPPAEFRVADLTATDLLIDLPAVANAEVYRVQRRVGAGAWEDVGQSPVPFIIANGLTPSTAYDVRWQAETDTGAVLSAWSSPITATTDVVTAGRRLPNWIQNWVTATFPTVTGTTHNVSTQAQLNAALTAAVDGDEIVLATGFTSTGFTLPLKTTPGWVVIRSAALSNLPAKVRVTPSSAVHMPRIGNQDAFTACIRATAGTRGWWLAGLNVDPTVAPGVPSSYAPINLGGWSTLAQIPQDIVIDRCLARGHATSQHRRAVVFDVIRGMIRDSWIDRARETGADTQAVWINTTPGPVRIANNQLEGAGMSFLAGGDDTPVSNLVVEDIEFVGNTLFKPLEWMTSAFVNNIKNSFELKTGRRVLYSQNVAQNHPGTGQQHCCVLTPRNQYGGNPWVQVADVVLRGNRWNDVFGGVNILRNDNNHPSLSTERLLFRDEVYVLRDLGVRTTWAAQRAIQCAGISHLTIDNCTLVSPLGLSATTMWEFDQSATPGLTGLAFRNNVFGAFSFGLRSSAVAGVENLNTGWGSTWISGGNVLTGQGTNHADLGFRPANVGLIGFVDHASRNFALAPSSPYKNAGTDGRDCGADFSRVPA